jgi:hypothetical protein
MRNPFRVHNKSMLVFRNGFRLSAFRFQLLAFSLTPSAFRLSPFAFSCLPFTFRLSPFAFRLSPFAFRLLPFAFCLLAFTSSCWFNPNVQTPGQGYLQGEWQQDSVTNQKQLLTYSLYRVKFSCDSFFMSIHTFSKVNTGADTCMNSGQWMEYTRGVYEQKHDTVIMKGQFCNADMTIKDDKGCFRSGDYADVFKIKKLADSLILLASTSSVIPIKAHLIKRTSCHPKPI